MWAKKKKSTSWIPASRWYKSQPQGFQRERARPGSGSRGHQGAGRNPEHPPHTVPARETGGERTAGSPLASPRSAAHGRSPRRTATTPSQPQLRERGSFSGPTRPARSLRSGPGSPRRSPVPAARGSSRLSPHASGAASPASPPPTGEDPRLGAGGRREEGCPRGTSKELAFCPPTPRWLGLPGS